EYVDYYQPVARLRGNGIGVGFWRDADNTIIRFRKIHDVGQCQAYDHLIYLSHGNNVQLYESWLYHDPHGRSLQLYPAPTNPKRQPTAGRSGATRLPAAARQPGRRLGDVGRRLSP